MSVTSTSSTSPLASILARLSNSNYSTNAAANTATSSAATGTTSSGTPVASTAGQTLTAQDFMQLLTVQMENQDPTTPMDSNQEMEQIVQISSMQNMSTMSTDLTQMSAGQTWSLANSYLGRQVTLTDANGNNVSGQISAVNTSSSTPQIMVNGTLYPIADITSVQLSGSTTSTTTPTSG